MFHMKHNLRSGDQCDEYLLITTHRATMTPAAHSMKLVGTGSGFDLALESLLRAAIDLISPLPSDQSANRSIRFRAEASTREELVRACLENIVTEIAAFDACPAAITLDGIRPIDNGYRAWGSLFLDPERGPRQRLLIESSPIIDLGSERCNISVAVLVAQEL